jgi:hypothetical protein
MSLGLIRWGGLAAMVGAALWAITLLREPILDERFPGHPAFRPYNFVLLVIAVLLIMDLLGLHVRYKGSYGRLSTAGVLELPPIGIGCARKVGTRCSIIRAFSKLPKSRNTLMPAIPAYIIEPIWQQLSAFLPQREADHPLGCHRPRIPDRVVFEKLVQVLVFGCAYERIADESCSATTLRRRRDE